MRLLSLFLFSLSSLFAVPYTVTASGTFGGAVNTSTFTAPNQPWSFQFLIDSNPVPLSFIASNALLPISGFEYRLNGSIVPANPTSARFNILSSSGGFVILTPLEVRFRGPQMFSGTTDSPTILPGVYNLQTSSTINLATFTSGQVTISAAIPEPASVGLSLIGLVGLGLLRRRARR